MIFDLLHRTRIQAGVDCKKIAMCFGDIVQCRCPLNEIFVIPKTPPQVPFKEGAAEIYISTTSAKLPKLKPDANAKVSSTSTVTATVSMSATART